MNCNLTLSLFLLWPTGKGEELRGKPRSAAYKVQWLWDWNQTYIVFVGISALLHVLHGHFLHGAPWHGVLLLQSRRKGRKTPRESSPVRRSFLGAAEKVCTATLLCHQIRPLGAINGAVFPPCKSVASNVLLHIQPLRSHKLMISRVFGFSFLPPHSPAYPSSPTPITGTGTLHPAP